MIIKNYTLEMSYYTAKTSVEILAECSVKLTDIRRNVSLSDSAENEFVYDKFSLKLLTPRRYKLFISHIASHRFMIIDFHHHMHASKHVYIVHLSCVHIFFRIIDSVYVCFHIPFLAVSLSLIV